MGKREEIAECMQQLLDNQADECRWNDRLLGQKDFESFKEVILKRSEVIRRYYSENEELIKRLKEYAAEPIDLETAEGLFEASRQIILQGRMDPMLVTIVTKPIVDFYIAEGMKERAICSIVFYASAIQDYMSRLDYHWNMEEICGYYQWVVDNSYDYCNFKEARTRRNVISAYTNYIFLFTMSGNPEYFPKVMELLTGLEKLWTSKEVQALDGNNPEVSRFFVTQLYYIIGEMNDYSRDAEPGIQKTVVSGMKKFCEANKDDINWQKTVKYMKIQIANQEHIMNSKESAVRWSDLLDEFETPDWVENEARAQEIFQLASDTVLWAMAAATRSTHMNADEKEKYTTDILTKYERFVDNIPYAHMGAYVNDVFKQIMVKALPNIKTMRYREKLFNQMLIRRQPSTYLHTRMVEEISLLIAEEIIEKEPELFCSLPQYKSAEEVLRDKETLLDIIARGARLHDAGKCNIASVIMQQSRKLTDDEFVMIKSHPVIGCHYFEGLEDSAVYADIIKGHHRSFDGKAGYPADFCNTSSPYHFLIDLIAISDSTDAATDILGRNYAEGKDFRHLLKELEAGAGSRYNPEIVRVIATSPELIEKLSVLTGARRLVYSYEAYCNVVAGGLSEKRKI